MVFSPAFLRHVTLGPSVLTVDKGTEQNSWKALKKRIKEHLAADLEGVRDSKWTTPISLEMSKI